MSEGKHDVAQVCINGHVVNDSSIEFPQHNQKFCETCGEKTITSCRDCGTNIRGNYHVPDVIDIGFDYIPPKYCFSCGSSFPWTKEKLDAAKELVEILDNLAAEEKEDLKKSLDELVKDGPRTVVATTKVKKVLAKTGPTAIEGFKSILTDILSETVKKSLWG